MTSNARTTKQRSKLSEVKLNKPDRERSDQHTLIGSAVTNVPTFDRVVSRTRSNTQKVLFHLTTQ